MYAHFPEACTLQHRSDFSLRIIPVPDNEMFRFSFYQPQITSIRKIDRQRQ